MELEYEGGSEYYETLFYTKLVSNKELCLICMCEENDPWDRYQLKCGHIFHTRCLRLWCSKKNNVNCSYCGDIEKDEFLYCDSCKTYGHNIIKQGYNVCPKNITDNKLLKTSFAIMYKSDEIYKYKVIRAKIEKIYDMINKLKNENYQNIYILDNITKSSQFWNFVKQELKDYINYKGNNFNLVNINETINIKCLSILY
jgi:hypothetical protein